MSKGFAFGPDFVVVDEQGVSQEAPKPTSDALLKLQQAAGRHIMITCEGCKAVFERRNIFPFNTHSFCERCFNKVAFHCVRCNIPNELATAHVCAGGAKVCQRCLKFVVTEQRHPPQAVTLNQRDPVHLIKHLWPELSITPTQEALIREFWQSGRAQTKAPITVTEAEGAYSVFESVESAGQRHTVRYSAPSVAGLVELMKAYKAADRPC